MAGTIYKITNNINGKIYIGKTIRSPEARWNEHMRNALSEQDRYNTPLYLAMRKHGIKNFNFEIIEQNISEDKINEREKYYINYFHTTSHENGYNITLGGDGGRTSTKLTNNDVKNIQSILLDENNILSFRQIGKLFNVEGSAIRGINIGECWQDEKLTYPLRRYSVTGLTLSKQKYKEIVELLQNSNLQLNELMKEYELTESQMSAINNGRYCYNGKHEYYKNIYSGPFPIRQIKLNKKLTKETFIPILYDCIYTKDSMATLGKRYHQTGNTLQYIFAGNRRKELTKDFLTPIR